MSRDPDAVRCDWCDRRLLAGERDTHHGWHRDIERGVIPANTPDPIPDRSWVAPWALAS